jgi:DNA-binding beta-propeller fold protein YncE
VNISRTGVSVAVVVVALVAGAAIVLIDGDPEETSFNAEVSAAPAPFDARLEVGGEPKAMGEGFGSIWVAVPDRRVVLRIDARTNHTLAAVPFDGTTPCPEIAADEKWVWVGDCETDRVTVIDPATNRVLGEVQGQGIAGAASIDEGMWVWSNIEGKLTLFNDVSEQWERKFQLWSNLTVGDAVVGFGKVWVLDSTERAQLSPVDERTGGFPDLNVSDVPTDVAVGAGAVWIASEQDGVVLRFDPKTAEFTERIDAGDPGARIDLAAGHGAVWVRSGGTLSRIDPKTNAIREAMEVPGGPAGIAVDGGVWIGNRDGSVWRLELPK